MFSNKHRNAFRTSFLLALCIGTLFSSATFCDAQDIWFTYVPPYGTYDDLSGEVSGVTFADHKVLVYIYVGGWWTKPTWAEPMTTINPDGTWTCNITTGGASDTTATKIIAFLIPQADYDTLWERSGQASLPAELYLYPYVEVPRTIAGRAIHFAEHNWFVKVGDNLGPGPNNFSDSTSNVWIDGNGYLHLAITYDSGKWYCSEIISDESFGYGTYVYTIQSNVDLFDRNIILGLFTWDTDAPVYNYREIDFEFGTWGNPANNNSQYVIQPWDTPGNMVRFDIDYTGPTTTTTHIMTWRPNGIYFKSYYGDFSLAPPQENFIYEWLYTGSDNPPPGGENARINFWLMSGLPPNNGIEAEVVIKDFQFLTDISDQPADIDDDTHVNLADFAQIAARWQDTSCDIYNTWCGEADLTCNGNVGIEDILALVAYWLESQD